MSTKMTDEEVFEKLLVDIPNPGIEHEQSFKYLVQYGVVEKDKNGKIVPTREFMTALYMFGQPGSSLYVDEHLPKLTVEEREKDNVWRINQGIEIALRAFIGRHTVSHETFDFVCAIVKELREKIMNDGWLPNGYWYPRRFSKSESFHSKSEVFKDPFRDHWEAKAVRGYDVSAKPEPKPKVRKLTK